MDQTLLWTKVAALGQVAGAIATFAAVWVSLWLARTERRPSIKVQAGLRLLFAGDGSPFEDIVSVQITNYGLRHVRVTQIGWRTGWLSHGPEWLQFKYAIQMNKSATSPQTPPFDLGPGQEAFVQLTAAPFQKAGEVRDTFFNRERPWMPGPSRTKICVLVYMSASKPLVARVEPDLETFLATGVIARGAVQANAKAKARPKDW